ncbi:MAG: hypothetical protein ACR2HH_15670 [Chthoniobacterales bacterium]
MESVDVKLDQLLRAAAAAPAAEPLSAPFGFATRVVAQWRAGGPDNGTGLRAFTRLCQRVAVAATLVFVCASAGAYWQFSQNDELTEPTANAYAIADSAIEAGTLP